MKTWIPLYDEIRGAIKDKIWLSDGENLALFKPDSEIGESKIEHEVYKIAKELGISHAKTEIFEFQGKSGTLSHNFKTNPSVIYCAADSVYIKSENLTYLKKDTQSNYLPRISRVSMNIVQNSMPAIQKDVVEMLFLDCLVSNRDRHGNNWEIMMKPDSTIIGVAPLFDHGLSLWNNYHEMMDYSMVLWNEGEIELKHFEMFEKLAQNYPEEVKQLLDKCQNIELNNFVSERFSKMKEIYQQCILTNEDQIKKQIQSAGYKPTERLVDDMKQVNVAFQKNLSVKEIRGMVKGNENISLEKRALLDQTAKDFIQQEQMEIAERPPVNQPEL